MKLLISIIAASLIATNACAADTPSITGIQTTQAYGGFGGTGGKAFHVEYFFHTNGAVYRFTQPLSDPQKMSSVLGLWVKGTDGKIDISWFRPVGDVDLEAVGTESLLLDAKVTPVRFQVEKHTDYNHVGSYTRPQIIRQTGKQAESTLNILRGFPSLVKSARRRQTDPNFKRQLDEIHQNFDNNLRKLSNEYGKSLGLQVVE